MTASQFLERARELDDEIQALDRRRLLAVVNHAPSTTLQRLEARRNQLVRDWANTWQTCKVTP